MPLIVRVDGVPAWAGGAPAGANLEAVRDFYENAARYGADIVVGFEILNEPNLPFEWGGPPSAAAYTAFLKAAYKGIKAGNPDALVIGGGPSPNTGGFGGTVEDLDFMNGMYDAGAKGYFDIIHDVDLFVFLDDVQYTKQDWRNRNRIKTPAGPRWLTVPIRRRRTRICEAEISGESSPFGISGDEPGMLSPDPASAASDRASTVARDATAIARTRRPASASRDTARRVLEARAEEAVRGAPAAPLHPRRWGRAADPVRRGHAAHAGAGCGPRGL